MAKKLLEEVDLKEGSACKCNFLHLYFFMNKNIGGKKTIRKDVSIVNIFYLSFHLTTIGQTWLET